MSSSPCTTRSFRRSGIEIDTAVGMEGRTTGHHSILFFGKALRMGLVLPGSGRSTSSISGTLLHLKEEVKERRKGSPRACRSGRAHRQLCAIACWKHHPCLRLALGVGRERAIATKLLARENQRFVAATVVSFLLFAFVSREGRRLK
jgi:hypothetical protein